MRTLTTDLLILGSAGCGMTAAVRAKELGFERVTVLEKGKITGGNTRMSAGMWAVGSHLQQRMGIVEDPDACFEEYMDLCDWEANPKLVRRFIYRSGEVVNWLEAHGVPFDDVVWKGGGRSVHGLYHKGRKVVHMAQARTGYFIVTELEKRARAMGVEFLLKTRAEKLLQDETGRVTGVIARCEEEEIHIQSDAVLLGTGTIASNAELIHQLLPQWSLDGMKIIGALPHATGDGFRMAKEIGAKTGIVNVVFISPHNHSFDMHIGFLGRRAECVWLNRNGERFFSEGKFNYEDYEWHAGCCLYHQPGGECWAMIDQALLDRWLSSREMLSSVEYFQGVVKAGLTAFYGSHDAGQPVDRMAWFDQVPEKIQRALDVGLCSRCGSLEEAAAVIGCDPGKLRETMYTYNEIYCENGYDYDFLKDKSCLTPLRTPPYYLFRMEQGLDSINGGIQIDADLHVVDEEWKPIPGLYAGGTCASGFTGRLYAFGGTCLGSAVYSGYCAPETILKDLS